MEVEVCVYCKAGPFGPTSAGAGQLADLTSQ